MSDTDATFDVASSRGVRGCALVALAAVAFLSGVVSAYLESFPYTYVIQPAAWAFRAQQSDSGPDLPVYESDLWHVTEHTSRGVTRHEEDRSNSAYTLYSAGHEASARLIDSDGELLHRWKMPIDETYPDAGPSRNFFTCRQAHVFPDGDLLALYMNVLGKEYGSRLVRLSADSDIQWQFDGKVHHDFAIREDGTIWVLTMQSRSPYRNPVRGVPQYPRYINEGLLVRLDEDGDPVERINLLDLLAESEFGPLLQVFDGRSSNPIHGFTQWDVLHTNDVDIVSDDFAQHHEGIEEGDLLLSFRTLDLVVVIDRKTHEVHWGSRGYWLAQHDPDALANGHLLVFDNRGHGGVGGTSRVLEYNPSSNAVEWSYHGSEDDPFETDILGLQQRLRNGHVLVTASKQGRLFEVDRTGEIVWEFRPPFVERWKGRPYAPTVFFGKRIARDRLSFEFDRPDRR